MVLMLILIHAETWFYSLVSSYGGSQDRCFVVLSNQWKEQKKKVNHDNKNNGFF